MPTFQHDGLQFYYEVSGEGPAVVLCHGLTGDQSQPKAMAGELPSYQRIVWDTRAHGQTQPLGPVEQLSFATFAADLRALLNHLQVEQAIVGGISMGAGVSVRLAIDHPKLVRALILVRPAWLDQPRPANLMILPKIAELLERYGPEEALRQLPQLPEFSQINLIAPNAAVGLCQQLLEPEARERRARLTRLPHDRPIDHWGQVASLAVPALVIGNLEDPLHPIAWASEWARRLPQGQLVQVAPRYTDLERHNLMCRQAIGTFLETLPC